MMKREKGQTLMFNTAELSLIKTVFADNEDLIYAIRNVLLQFPVSDAQRETLKQVTPEVFAVVKKRIFPDLDPEAPLFQLSDLYQSLNPDLKGKSPDELELIFASKQLQIEYLAQQFEALEAITRDAVANCPIQLAEMALLKGKPFTQAYIDTSARNYLLIHVDSFLNHIKTLAGQVSETKEEQAKRLTRDSTK